ncbi:MAG: nitronate monooxygenase [Sneathiella sp.]
MSKIASLCGVDNPVFQAGLGGIAGPKLTAAVSNAGGLGHLGCIRQSAKDVRNWIQETRALTDNPFGVNLVPKGGGPDGFEAQLAVVLEEKPKAISLFWDDFSGVIPRCKEAGIVTMVQVGSLVEARKAAADGADIIIAQGVEAGGHVRGTVGLSVLLLATLKAVGDIPVLAAGGISSSTAVKAAMGSGAAGAWVGTSFVASDESLAHPIYKRRLIEAATDDTKYERLYSFGWPVGTPYRIIEPKRKTAYGLVAGGARHFDKDHKAEALKLYAGQGVGEITEILPASEILKNLSKID